MNFTSAKNKKVGIIGLGYIGRNILTYLESLGIKVVCITRNNIDIIERESFDYLINASGNSGDFRDRILETVESNIGLNCYILKVAKVKYSYIYLSSSRVYGYSVDDSIVFDENYLSVSNSLDLDFIYDGSKRLAESLLFNCSRKKEYSIGILRLSNVYGRFDCLDDATFIKKVVRYKKESLTGLKINQNRFSKKDYVHIDDVVRNVVNVMLNIKKTDVYNFCSGKSYSIDEISRFLNLNVVTNELIEPVYSNLTNSKIKKHFPISFTNDFEIELKNTVTEG